MKKIFLITIVSLALFLVMPINKVRAATGDEESCKQKCIVDSKNLTDEDKCTAACIQKDSTAPTKAGCVLDKGTGQEICSLENPIGLGVKGTTDFNSIISLVIKTALSIIGALTLLMLVWGGFQWLTSAGNPEKVKSGTQTMIWAIIGVALVFASYLVLSTFTNYLTGGIK
jgi:hypothetical protein